MAAAPSATAVDVVALVAQDLGEALADAGLVLGDQDGAVGRLVGGHGGG